MAPRYLTLPSGATGPPSGYSPSLADQRVIYAALASVSQDVAINGVGEGLPAEYPTPQDVAAFVTGGGVYIDMCGWPMSHKWYGSGSYIGWSDFIPGNFGVFMSIMGIDQYYVDTFIPYSSFNYGIMYLICSSQPYDRMLVSGYRFPQSNSVIIAPQISTSCQDDQIPPNTYYAYSMIAVRAGAGWYFWASGNKNGVEVNAAHYAQWIRSVLGYQSTGGSNSGGGSTGGSSLCPPGQYLPAGSYAPGGCVLQCGANQSLINGQCVSQGTGSIGTTTQAGSNSNINWPLIIGGGVAGIGLIVAAIVLMSGGK